MNCIKCFHFKTKIIHRKNVKSLEFERIGKILQAIRKRGKVRIFWCKWGLTPAEAYVEYNHQWHSYSIANKLEVKNCKMKDV